MLTLFCAIVGETGSAFAVEVEENKSVDALKDAIKRKKERKITCDADTLQLFLGKKSEVTWLDSSSEDVQKLKKGEKTDHIEALTLEGKELQGEFGLEEVLEDMPIPKTKEIHILVVVPENDQEQWDETLGRKKGRGDEMEINSSPTTFDSPGAFFNTRIDGIDLGTEHLKRNELVEKLHRLVSIHSIVLLSSPAASGKSSLFKLYQAASRNIKVLGISFLDERTPFALLSQAGIDIEQRIISKSLANQEVVVILDDAQKKYGELLFWESLIKGTGIWMPSNIKFIISATHSLSGGKQSPIEFISLPRLSRMDFLLTDEEAYQLLEFRDTGLPENIRQHKILKDVLVKECGGLVGALRLSIDALKREFFSFMNDAVEETLCLQYCLTDPFVQDMARCFGGAHSYPAGNDFKRFLKDCFENKWIWCNGFTNLQDDNSYSSLKNAGILVERSGSYFGFSSPLAKRYYFKWIFPNRSQTAPSSLQELISKVVSNMSSTVLKNSSHPGDFPKEDVFQHLFMEGLVLHTPPNCSICTELSKIFPSNTNLNTKQVIANDIDFYLNGSLHWGIELLVNGGGIEEHLSRFSLPNGKYMSLAVNDYAIVDFRRNVTNQPTNFSKNPNHANYDYSVAQCLFGEDTVAIEISLAN